MFSHLKHFFLNSRSLSIGSIFSCMGWLFGNWVTQIPFIKSKFELDDGQLGLLLLFMPLGTIFLGPFISRIIYKIGVFHTTIVGATIMAITYAFPVNMPSVFLTGLLLSCTGASIALTNVAMNACVIEIEENEGIFIMSACHGMFSLGGMLGASMASFLTGQQITAQLQMIFAAVLAVVVVLSVRSIILKLPLTVRNEAKPSKFRWPKGVLLNLVLISFCTNITEGTMADWTAVFMRDVVEASPYFVGWGFAFYAFFMAFGRFIGDKIVPRFGKIKVLIFSGITCAFGLLIAIILPYTISSIVGFSFVGLGISCCAPILYSTSMNLPNMTHGAGLATMNSFSIFGFLAGPAVIGLLSSTFGLVWAFGIVAILCLFWVAMVIKTKF